MIIAVAGGRGSGKTTIAEALSKILDSYMVSFGTYVRAIAKRQGIVDPLQLQAFGESLIKAGVDDFVASVLTMNGSKLDSDDCNIVVEGVRHSSVVKSLTKYGMSMGGFRMIYLEAPIEIRMARLALRGEESSTSFSLEMHNMEKQLKNEILTDATTVIDASSTFEKVLADCLNVLRGG
jgi:cytidylate kinase